MEDEQQADSAFAFTGDWREFAPIAFTNLLLTIVTLGIYRFWATTRERRYLWSRTRFIDDRLEWTGTGLELFIGFLLVFALLLGPLLFLQFGLQAMIMRGYEGAAFAITAVVYLFILYLVGVAVFRALRYRLSRTYWHGIRGGSDEQGWIYGLIHLAFSFASGMTLGLIVPFSMTTRWNYRWSAMSFGPHKFDATAKAGPIFGRFLLFYLIPILIVILLVVGFVTGAIGERMSPSSAGGAAFAVAFVIAILLFYVVTGLIALMFYSAYYREAVGALRLSDLSFAFTARSKDWFLLILGNIALVIVTLGIGIIFLRYRNWKFFITHLEASGEINLDRLTQSATREPGQGEGLLDAFDVGAI